MILRWTYDTMIGLHTGWIHPEGPQHIHQDPLGDRYCIQTGRRSNNTNYYRVSLVRWRAAGAQVGHFETLDNAKAAAETHAQELELIPDLRHLGFRCEQRKPLPRNGLRARRVARWLAARRRGKAVKQ